MPEAYRGDVHDGHVGNDVTVLASMMPTGTPPARSRCDAARRNLVVRNDQCS
jgi:hypothetical protein